MVGRLLDQLRPGLGAVLGLAVITTALGVLLGGSVPASHAHHSSGRPRVVSLTPSITDTLFAIGAGDLVAGMSDYCSSPAGTRAIPRVGTGITPNFERMAALEPTLVVGEPGSAVRPELSALGDTHWLPWFSLDEVVRSTRELGRLTGHETESSTLARQFEAELGGAPPRNAPRVLVVLGTGFGHTDQWWYARHGCLHDRALQAAGGVNAVPDELAGPPSLSLEQLVRIDPDVVMLLSEHREPAWTESMLGTLRRSVRGRIVLIAGPDVLSTGPRILELVKSMRREIERTAPGA
jgi:ABC-type Fe3+-hydroxamate transport system substrate-binding protein